jgi:hypothetical protein
MGDRSLNRELELRTLLREMDKLDVQAQRLDRQMRQLQLNEIAKLDPRDYILSATEAKLTADRLGQATDGMERRAKDASRGSYRNSSTIPGLLGTVKDRSSRLVKDIREIQKELERLRSQAQAKLMDPMRHAGGATLAFPVGDVLSAVSTLMGEIGRIIEMLRGL